MKKRRKKSRQDAFSDASTNPPNSPSCTSTADQFPTSSATATPSRHSYYGEHGEGREDEDDHQSSQGRHPIEEEEDEEEAWMSLQFVEDQPLAAEGPSTIAEYPEKESPRFNTAFLLMLVDSLTKRTLPAQDRKAIQLYCEAVVRPYSGHTMEQLPSLSSAREGIAVPPTLTKLALDSFVDVILRQ